MANSSKMEKVNVNIRQYRKKNKLTLRELAKRLDVSASFLSQVETGKVVPSIATLYKISNVLHTTIGNLLGENNSFNEKLWIKKEERTKLKDIGSGLEVWLLASHDPYRQMEPILYIFHKGGTTGDLVQHYGQEFVFILEGKLEINLNHKKFILEKGDSFYFNSYIPHQFNNAHDNTTEVIRVITPPLYIT